MVEGFIDLFLGYMGVQIADLCGIESFYLGNKDRSKNISKASSVDCTGKKEKKWKDKKIPHQALILSPAFLESPTMTFLSVAGSSATPWLCASMRV